MSDDSVSASFDQLMDALAGYCGRRRSGTLFIVTADNHAARFVLDQGEIVTCNYSMKQGHDALPLLRNIKDCSYRFADDVFSAIGELPMPPTDKCLKYLRGDPARTAPAAAAGSGALDILKEELTRAMGPVAGILLDGQLRAGGVPQTQADLSALIQRMAGQIGNAGKAQAFIAALARRIT